MVYSIYLDTSLEHCLKRQKTAKHIYCMKIKLLLVSCHLLRHLKNDSTLLFYLMQLFILVISFLFIWALWVGTHCPFLSQLIQSILFCFRLLAFLIVADSVSSWFLLHMWHTQLQSSELHVLHCHVR